jgi:hypothetical protein
MPECAASITPDSKLGDLLERWPQLEGVLLELSPHFQALQNPVLRRTVAKLATLRQVSAVSGVGLGVLVGKLREGAGLAPLALPDEGGPARERPAWAAGPAVTRTHDARPTIAAGEHPMARVLADLAALADGEVYALVTPFVPAPLVELARERGFAAFSAPEGDDVVRTYFRRDGAAPAAPHG